ncbi:fasciclin domain-containing protein [Cyanobium sp. HWJ4-Hawea]|uniref:fasciclin domain-containing protein n=1 Tax=Cyanobium sp. HWJ4-Hawea TaxID=2823713 RepID=UPI0020CEA092|nr:fasciclin domain-containing protein [Cyanobium sp. HWJ4-Hawea]MCP9808819.1 fasciclin domain-containing protein [Cyanobium sp. HWJ4-Hawea]
MATILETAKGAGVFNTLLAAVDAAGLRSALEGPGPFTVFAPVDDAFAALPPGTVQTLVDNPPQLARILKYHVLSGAFKRAEIVAQAEWTSLEGAPIPIRRGSAGDEPFEIKNATVLTADIACENGVVHVIDRVILPG